MHIEKYEIFLSCQFRSKKDRNGWAEEGASLDGVLGKSVFIPEMQVLKSSIRLACKHITFTALPGGYHGLQDTRDKSMVPLES